MQNKYSILLGVSVANVIWFVISFFKMVIGDSSDAAENYGLGLSVIAGIILAIITIVQMVKQYKNYKATQPLVPFFIACFKKENGKQMFHLLIALILNALPLVLIVGFLMLGAASGTASNNNNNQRSNTAKPQANNNNQRNSTAQPQTANNNLSNQEINKIAGNSNNNIKTIPEGLHKEIQKIYMNNPGISDEDAFAIFNKHNPGHNIETVRAHKPSMEMSYQEINKIAGNSNNNIKTIPEGLHNEIQKMYKNNPGLSDEEAFAIFNKSHPGHNIETVRAHKPSMEMSYQEINKIAGNSNNNIKTIPEGLHNEIQKMYKNNPGLSDEEAFAIFNKSHPGHNIETVRAHKPR